MIEIEDMTVNKAWIKNVTVNNRNFKITFYRDSWNILWFRIEEIYRQKKNIFDLTWKEEICRRWTDEEETIIEQALTKIDELFAEEEKTKKVEKALDKFADYIV